MKKILERFIDAMIVVSILSTTIFLFSLFTDHTKSISQPPENPPVSNVSPEEFNRNLLEWQKQLYDAGHVSAGFFEENLLSGTPTEMIPIEVNSNEYFDVTTEIPLEKPIEIPEEIQNPYDFLGIKFDSSQEIDIVFFTDIGQIPFVFIPAIPTGNTDEHGPGSGYSRVYADPYGNITINPHSGNQCFFNKQYEAEKLREYLEGGNCIDTMVSYSERETQRRVENIQDVVMYQNDQSVIMDIVAFDIIPTDQIGQKLAIEPKAISNLLGFELTEKSIVLITCGWSWGNNGYSWFDDSYAQAERILMVLQPRN